MKVIEILLEILRNYGGEILIAFVAWVLRLVEKPRSNTKAIIQFVKWSKTHKQYNIDSLFEQYKEETKAKPKNAKNKPTAWKDIPKAQ